MNTIAHIVQKVALSLLVLFTVTGLSAQVVINPHPIAGFQFSSKDILNFDVVYSHTENVKVQYDASLLDANGRLVVQFISGTHVLKPGANSYNPGNFNIAQTRYVNRTIAEIEKTTKFLPSGDYTFCINIRCVDQREVCQRAIKIEIDYSACSDAHAEPITPLLLSFPEDEAEIDNKRPNFSWIPPMPIGNNPNMRYTYTLVHMLNDQTAEDAIRRNRSLFTQNGIRSISLMFPNQLDDLEEGEHYAWQVSAHIGQQHIATSEVWEFEIEEGINAPFVNINQTQLGIHTCSSELRILFTQYYGKQKLNFKILDQTGNDVTPAGLNFNLVQGENKLVMPVQDNGLEVNQTYQFIITDAKNKKYKLHFQCKKD